MEQILEQKLLIWGQALQHFLQ